MKPPAMLPFQGAEVPHYLLDILRGCNVRCRTCYNTEAPKVRPLPELLAELDRAQALRHLDCVTLIGGEPLLHPELPAIIGAVRERGLRVAIFTNALGLDLEKARALREAGLELVVMHLEEGQEREDLAPGGLARLRAEKLALVSEAGLEGGLSITAMPGREAEVGEAVDEALASPHLSFLLVTLYQDPASLTDLAGDIHHGFRAVGPLPPLDTTRAARTAAAVETVNGRLGLPFTYHSSIHGDPRWFSHLVATVHRKGEVLAVRPLRITRLDMALNRLMRLVRGRYFFYQPQRRRTSYIHLILNALAGGGLAPTLRTVARALRPQASLRMKRFLLQVPAGLDAQGRVTYCRDCPDATLRHGGLVPICLVDRVVGPA